MTVLMVLHDVNLAARFATRIAAVKDGRLHAVEDYEADGSLTMLQRYYYRDIQVPAEGGENP